jgi:ABC-type nickel/cobalt efflux system permease component RcnA
LKHDPRSGSLVIKVDYSLQVDEFTVVLDDLPAVIDKVDMQKLRKPQDYYESFTRLYAPILAANLVASLDGQSLDFQCIKHGHRLRDEKGGRLDHLRCDFVFEASCRFPQIGTQQHAFTFKEGNYELEEGRIAVSLVCDGWLDLQSKTEADEALKNRPPDRLQPGDDARLRAVTATFVLSAEQGTPGTAPATAETDSTKRFPTLYQLFRDTEYGFLMLLCLSAGIGAVHALTPGHGKTLVAAYLVGERGTVAHAVLLGVVTTVTHTGVVILVAIALRLFFPQGGMSDEVRRNLQTTLGLLGGFVIVAMGVWLLLRRLAGQADHFHLSGHGHHHHHPHPHHGVHDHVPADHCHDETGQAQPLPTALGSVGWWNLIVLGISGGIVPCWDAILMLIVAVSLNLLWLALPMLLAFSAGLAGVLVLIGITVVRAKGIAGSRWAQNRLFKALPVISAALVTGLGLWLCYDSVHPRPELDIMATESRR